MLLSSSSSNKGRLEVYINGEWGTVCNDNWGSSDALVACRQLGYSGVSSYHISVPSGSSSQRIWLDHVECSGSESKLINCNHRGYGVHSCSHSEDVGIRCQGMHTLIYAIHITCGLLVVCEKEHGIMSMYVSWNMYGETALINCSSIKFKG